MRLNQFFGLVAVLSLMSCLAAAVLVFMGKISKNDFQAAFLVASLLWFIFAVLRFLTKK